MSFDNLVADIQQAWEEKYRPRTLDDFILTKEHRTFINNMITTKQLKNIVLSSKKGGSGKTSLAKWLPEQFEAEMSFINGSKDGSINLLDTLGNIIESSSIMSNSEYKIIVFDESDGTSAQFKKAVKGFIEKYEDRARFIYTTNFINNLTEHEMSRLTNICFDYNETQLKELRPQLKDRLIKICNTENVEYDIEAIDYIVSKFTPDFRKSVEILEQAYLTYGKISKELCNTVDTTDGAEILNLIYADIPFMDKFTKFESLIKDNIGMGNSLISAIDEQIIPFLVQNNAKHVLFAVCELNTDTIYKLQTHYQPELLFKHYFCQITKILRGE